MSKKVDAIKLLEAIEKGFTDKFDELRNIYFNPNTKGYEYELILKEFLESYFSGFYEFYVRVPLIDFELDALSTFASGENEFDVVCTYKTAIPKIIYKAHETPFVPYDAVAFTVEVKQTLTKSALEKDLKKLDKLSKLKVGQRWGARFGGTYTIERPLKILFYYESEISLDALVEALNKYRNAWDFLMVLTENVTYGNPSLPIIGKRLETEKITRYVKYPLVHLMYLMMSSLPYPLVVDTSSLFINLLSLGKD